MHILLLIFEVLALASYLWHQFIHLPLNREGILLYLDILSFAALTLMLGTLIYLALRIYTGKLASQISESSSSIIRSVIVTLSPLLFLYFIFLQYLVFLKDIRPVLLPLSLIGFASLHAIFLFRLSKKYPGKIFVHKMWNKLNPDGLSSSQMSAAVFLAAFLVYCLLASGLVSTPHPFTGDEPHYLLISESILHDGDLNLFNNYRDKDYLKYYPGEMLSHALPGKNGGQYLYSKHLPGLPALLIPSYFLGEMVSSLVSRLHRDSAISRRILVFMSRLPMCLLAAILSLVFFLLVQDMVVKRSVSLLSWFVFSFTSPVLFYSQLIYPEVPAALILLLVFKQSIYKWSTSPRIFLLAGIGIATLPWLGVKYAALAAVVMAVIGLPLLKSVRENLKKIFFLVSPFLISTGLFLFYLWSLYGNFSPVSIYTGTLPQGGVKLTAALNPSFSEMLRMNLGFFFDQRIGIFVYAPIYMFFITGIFFAAQKIRRVVFHLLAIFAFFWVFCSLFPYAGGFCPPGRPLLPVLWIAAIFIAMTFTEKGGRLFSIIKKVGITLCLLAAYLGIRNPMILYHENLSNPLSGKGQNSNLLASLSNAFIDLRKAVPSLMGQERIDWLPLIFWLSAVFFVTFVLLRSRRARVQEFHPEKLGIPAACVLIVSLFLICYLFFDIHLDSQASFEDKDYELIFQDENHYGPELGGFWTKGNRRTGVLIRSPEPLTMINLQLSSAVMGKTEVQVDRFRGIVTRTRETGFERSVRVSSPVGFPWKGGYLYSVQLKEHSSFVPYKRDKRIKDNRTLGIFVEINTCSSAQVKQPKV